MQYPVCEAVICSAMLDFAIVFWVHATLAQW